MPPPSFPESVVPLAQAEREYLRSVVARFQGSRSELANVLGLSSRTLFRKLKGLHASPARNPLANATQSAGAGVAEYVPQNGSGAGRNVPGYH
jgi:hypothetical protein